MTTSSRPTPRGQRRLIYISDPSSIAVNLLPDPVEPGDLRRWVDMLADSGVDTLNQEVYNQGWTVYWRSEKLQYDQRPQHQRFLPILNAGIQPVEVLLDQSHKRAMTFVAGFRMNDTHNFPVYADFIESHPEFWLTDFPEGENYRHGKPLDFSFAGVREWIFEVMRELVTRFDVDGLELCFRDAGYFPFPHGRERAHLMTDLVRKIRAMLDEQGKQKRKKLLLGARVCSTLEECLNMGLDVPTWIGGGLIDYLSPQDVMFADFNAPYAEFAALTREAQCMLYPALLPWTSSRTRRRLAAAPLTPANCRALAQTFYSAGADGISIYNHFVGAVWHPPFYPQALQVFHGLRDPQTVARGERHYVFDPSWAGEIGFGPDRCATGVLKAQRIVLDRCDQNAAGEYRFRLYEETARIHGATILFRGFGLTERDELEVRLNGMPIASDTVGRTRPNSPPSHEQQLLTRPDGRSVRCIPEQGRVTFAPDPGPFSTRWFPIPAAGVAWGDNVLGVRLTSSDAAARGEIIIDEVEAWVQPR